MRCHRAWRKITVLLVLLFGLLLISIPNNQFIYKQIKSLWTRAPSVKAAITNATDNSTAYGVNVDITSMLPGTAYTITTASGGDFFDLAAQLGINTLRITDISWEMTGKEYSQAAWQHVFDRAEHYHMKIILLLMDGNGQPVSQQAHTLLGNYGLAHSSALWMVDLYNEPDVSDTRLVETLREEATYIHQVAPTVHITIGGWKSQVPGHPGEVRWQDPRDIPGIINLVDVVSPHLYEFEEGMHLGFTPQKWTQRYLSQVRQQALHKPILLEEFGAGNGLAPTISASATGSLTWQDSVYQGVLQEVSAERNQGVIGAVAWIITPRPAWPHPGPGNYEGNMVGWAFVLNQGNHLLPAAKEFLAAAAKHVRSR